MRAAPASCWLHPSVAVRVSSIAGRGLFATNDIGVGTPVSRLGGRLVDTAGLRSFSAGAEADRSSVDTVVVAPDRHLVLAPGSDNRFGNHSCDPNLGWTDEYTLAAVSHISAGTELVSDYAMCTADPDYLLRCHCESYRCRQVVEGDDWRIPQLRLRYRDWWTPYVRRQIDLTSSQVRESRPLHD